MGNENGKGKEVEEGEMKRRRGRGRESRRGNEMGKERTGKVKCETGNDEGGGLEESFRSLLFQAILSFRTNHKVMARQSYFHAFSVDKNSRWRCHIAGYPRQSAKRKASFLMRKNRIVFSTKTLATQLITFLFHTHLSPALHKCT